MDGEREKTKRGHPTRTQTETGRNLHAFTHTHRQGETPVPSDHSQSRLTVYSRYGKNASFGQDNSKEEEEHTHERVFTGKGERQRRSRCEEFTREEQCPRNLMELDFGTRACYPTHLVPYLRRPRMDFSCDSKSMLLRRFRWFPLLSFFSLLLLFLCLRREREKGVFFFRFVFFFWLFVCECSSSFLLFFGGGEWVVVVGMKMVVG